MPGANQVTTRIGDTETFDLSHGREVKSRLAFGVGGHPRPGPANPEASKSAADGVVPYNPREPDQRRRSVEPAERRRMRCHAMGKRSPSESPSRERRQDVTQHDPRPLIEMATRGDPAAIDELLVQHLPALHAFVRLRAGRAFGARESTSDVVQSVCREVLEDAGEYRYQGEAAFKNWLFTAAANKVVDRHRFHHRGRRDAGREVAAQAGAGSDDATRSGLADAYATLATPSRAVMQREEMERLEAAVSQLPEHQREVILLSRIAGLTYAQIAEETGRTEVAVRGLVARGLVRLATVLRRPEGEA